MRRIIIGLIISAAVLPSADQASAQWRWRDDGTPERVGPPAARGYWGRDQGFSSWDRGYYAFPPPAARPPPAVGGDLRDGGPRPEILPVAAQVVAFSHPYPAGSIVIDGEGRRLYYVLPDRTAYAYVISVGREGFNWTGVETVSRKQAWPDWHPPAEMRERDPRLPEKMTGGIRNPLGAMALYLGKTLYRIHGTDDESTIGQASSSGCFRMTNANVLHLATLVEVGTPVHVVQSLSPQIASGVQRYPVPAAQQQQQQVPRAGPPPRTRRDPWYDWDRAPEYRRWDWQYGGWR